MRCDVCGGEVELRPFVSGSPNASWAVCRVCGRRRPVFVDDSEWTEWDMPVRLVDGTPVYRLGPEKFRR